MKTYHQYLREMALGDTLHKEEVPVPPEMIDLLNVTGRDMGTKIPRKGPDAGREVVNQPTSDMILRMKGELLTWCFTEGLRQALLNRRRFAQIVRQDPDLQGMELPDNRPEVFQQAIFNPAARQQIKVGNRTLDDIMREKGYDDIWFKGGQIGDISVPRMEPNVIEAFDAKVSTKPYLTFDLDDLNTRLKSPFHFGGSGGLIEYIENGNWRKIGIDAQALFGKNGLDLTLFEGDNERPPEDGIVSDESNRTSRYKFGINDQGGYVPWEHGGVYWQKAIRNASRMSVIIYDQLMDKHNKAQQGMGEPLTQEEEEWLKTAHGEGIVSKVEQTENFPQSIGFENTTTTNRELVLVDRKEDYDRLKKLVAAGIADRLTYSGTVTTPDGKVKEGGLLPANAGETVTISIPTERKNTEPSPSEDGEEVSAGNKVVIEIPAEAANNPQMQQQLLQKIVGALFNDQMQGAFPKVQWKRGLAAGDRRRAHVLANAKRDPIAIADLASRGYRALPDEERGGPWETKSSHLVLRGATVPIIKYVQRPVDIKKLIYAKGYRIVGQTKDDTGGLPGPKRGRQVVLQHYQTARQIYLTRDQDQWNLWMPQLVTQKFEQRLGNPWLLAPHNFDINIPDRLSTLKVRMNVHASERRAIGTHRASAISNQWHENPEEFGDEIRNDERSAQEIGGAVNDAGTRGEITGEDPSMTRGAQVPSSILIYNFKLEGQNVGLDKAGQSFVVEKMLQMVGDPSFKFGDAKHLGVVLNAGQRTQDKQNWPESLRVFSERVKSDPQLQELIGALQEQLLSGYQGMKADTGSKPYLAPDDEHSYYRVHPDVYDLLLRAGYNWRRQKAVQEAKDYGRWEAQQPGGFDRLKSNYRAGGDDAEEFDPGEDSRDDMQNQQAASLQFKGIPFNALAGGRGREVSLRQSGADISSVRGVLDDLNADVLSGLKELERMGGRLIVKRDGFVKESDQYVNEYKKNIGMFCRPGTHTLRKSAIIAALQRVAPQSTDPTSDETPSAPSTLSLSMQLAIVDSSADALIIAKAGADKLDAEATPDDEFGGSAVAEVLPDLRLLAPIIVDAEKRVLDSVRANTRIPDEAKVPLVEITLGEALEGIIPAVPAGPVRRRGRQPRQPVPTDTAVEPQGGEEVGVATGATAPTQTQAPAQVTTPTQAPAQAPAQVPTPTQTPASQQMPVQQPRQSRFTSNPWSEPRRSSFTSNPWRESFLQWMLNSKSITETEVVYDPKIKPKKNCGWNYWGKPGLPGGTEIGGEVETTKKDPDGDGTKQRRRR